MENISQTKHKGGRPRKHSKELIKKMRILYDNHVITERSIINRLYLGDAQTLLENSDEYNYLVDKKKHKTLRNTILTALGRVAEKYSNGDEVVLMLAKHICDNKLNTATAINFINNYRMQDKNSPKLNKNKVIGCLKKILTIINNSNFKEDEMQYFFFALKALAEENLPAKEEDEVDE